MYICCLRLQVFLWQFTLNYLYGRGANFIGDGGTRKIIYLKLADLGARKKAGWYRGGRPNSTLRPLHFLAGTDKGKYGPQLATLGSSPRRHRLISRRRRPIHGYSAEYTARFRMGGCHTTTGLFRLMASDHSWRAQKFHLRTKWFLFWNFALYCNAVCQLIPWPARLL